MILEITNQTDFALTSPFKNIGNIAEKIEGINFPTYVYVTLCNEEYIQQINREYRQKDSVTDVLSFPTVNYPVGKKAHNVPEKLRAELDPTIQACAIGDIIICIERAKEQALAYGHSLERELCYLFTHGIFHLFGYDHILPEDKKEMRAMEERTLNEVGIPLEPEKLISDDELVSLAREALKNSYSPYSNYAVGAALLCENGKVYCGCNIENASYGLTNCGERTAIYKAVSEGIKDFKTIAIASNGTPPYPCGACRQVLNEFAPHLRLLITLDDSTYTETTLQTLLPHGFGPKDLPKKGA